MYPARTRGFTAVRLSLRQRCYVTAAGEPILGNRAMSCDEGFSGVVVLGLLSLSLSFYLSLTLAHNVVQTSIDFLVASAARDVKCACAIGRTHRLGAVSAAVPTYRGGGGAAVAADAAAAFGGGGAAAALGGGGG